MIFISCEHNNELLLKHNVMTCTSNAHACDDRLTTG